MPVTKQASCSAALAFLACPVTAAALTFAAAWPQGHPYQTSAVVFIALLAVRGLSTREPAWARVLPFMGTVAQLLRVAVSAIALLALKLVGALPGIDWLSVTLIAGGAVLADAAAARIRARTVRKPPVRIAILGSESVAASLDREVRLAKLGDRYDIVGRIIAADEPWSEGDEVPVIGRVGELAEAVVAHNVDLLLISSTVPRMTVFGEVVRTCGYLPVRMHELSSFYEQVFCHVASAEINATWFQYVLHPRYKAGASPAERALDLLVAGTVAIIVALPLLGILALLIRRDGGPVFFRQTRIGESGQPFTMFKLRTMRTDNADARWSSADDSRVTPIGRLLRRTHLDELPQLLNVLRGEMSIVGPRPEQPLIVDELELLMPYYQRRHLVKPGVTGWAQVRCGYAGSHAGTAWKLCHDLYYLKHRSVWLNMVIIAETLRTLVADPQYTARPLSVDFILAPNNTPDEPPTILDAPFGVSATPRPIGRVAVAGESPPGTARA